MNEIPSEVIQVRSCGHCPLARWRPQHSTSSGGWCTRSGQEIHHMAVVLEKCPLKRGVVIVRLAEE